MSKLKEDNIDLTESIDKAEHYIKDNKKSLTIIFGAIIGVVAIYFGYQYFIVKPQEEDARKEMYVAERYFGLDSTKLAIKGDGSFPGFETITESYGSSKSGNLAQYYLGISLLKQGQFEGAIEALAAYDAEDDISGALALGGIAAAHLELGHNDEAITFYKKAAKYDANNFTCPLYLMKAAFVYELNKDFNAALELYNQIKKDYPNSTEAREIDKYIARAEKG